MIKKNLTCLQRGIYFLSKREYSQLELKNKLLKYNYPIEEVETVLIQLKAKNWQNNERFAAYIARKNIHKGQNKLLLALKNHNLAEEDIKSAKEIVQQNGSEYERASKLWFKKFADKKAPLSNLNNKQQDMQAQHKYQQKQIRFLISQGFSIEAAVKVVKDNNKKFLDYLES